MEETRVQLVDVLVGIGAGGPGCTGAAGGWAGRGPPSGLGGLWWCGND